MIKDLQPKIPITRRVSAGLPVTASKNHPEKLDYLLVSKDAKGELFVRDEEAHKLLGDQPRRIPIRLISDVVEENLEVQHALWIGARCMCSGDGEAALRRTDENRSGFAIECHSDGKQWPPRSPEQVLGLRKRVTELSNESAKTNAEFAARTPKTRGLLKLLECSDPAAPYLCMFKQNGDCKVTSKLIFRIEGLSGYARYQSHGINTARELLSSFALIQAETGGVLRNIPLVLVCKWGSVVTPDGKRVNSPIIHVEAGDMDPQRLKMLAAAEIKERAGLEGQIASERKMLVAAQREIDRLGTALEFGTSDEPVDVIAAEAEREDAPSGGLGGGK